MHLTLGVYAEGLQSFDDLIKVDRTSRRRLLLFAFKTVRLQLTRGPPNTLLLPRTTSGQPSNNHPPDDFTKTALAQYVHRPSAWGARKALPPDLMHPSSNAEAAFRAILSDFAATADFSKVHSLFVPFRPLHVLDLCGRQPLNFYSNYNTGTVCFHVSFHMTGGAVHEGTVRGDGQEQSDRHSGRPCHQRTLPPRAPPRWPPCPH